MWEAGLSRRTSSVWEPTLEQADDSKLAVGRAGSQMKNTWKACKPIIRKTRAFG